MAKQQKQPKKAASQPESEGEEGANSNQKEEDKKEQSFECKCGKRYGSLAAVHTHINNKHPEEKKQYKQNIKNPKKNGQGPSTSIRMKDINYHEQEADLMCLADTTVKNIFDFIKKSDELTKKTTSFLLDENAIDSFDELDDDEDIDINPRPNGTRDNQINQKIQALKADYNIQFLDETTKNAKEFEVFKLNKFNLMMIKELTKFFNPTFASKIQLELQIILAKSKLTEKDLIQRLKAVEAQIWGEHAKMA